MWIKMKPLAFLVIGFILLCFLLCNPWFKWKNLKTCFLTLHVLLSLMWQSTYLRDDPGPQSNHLGRQQLSNYPFNHLSTVHSLIHTAIQHQIDTCLPGIRVGTEIKSHNRVYFYLEDVCGLVEINTPLYHHHHHHYHDHHHHHTKH